MAKWFRRLGWGLVVILGLPLSAIVWLFVWLYSAEPTTEGDFLVSQGLNQPAEILRDSDGLVTIRANNEEDAAFALGFAHAQDRLEQLLLTRQIGQGRLSEALGGSVLKIDQLMRTLNLAALSEAAVSSLTDQNRQILEAYAAGINSYLDSPEAVFGPLVSLTNLDSSPWRPSHSILWGKLMALTLSGNWWQEKRNAALKEVLSAAELKLLYPDLPPDSPVTQPRETAWNDRQDTLLAALPPFLRSRGASNIFVVDGRHSSSGKPLLANDPHLGLEAPGHWYLARIETPAGVRAGATAPAIPGVVIGHNSTIAWGFTTTHSDTQDLILEKIADPDGLTYQTPTGPRAFDLREEIIQVRGGDPVIMTVRQGRFGPVISDLDLEEPLPEDQTDSLVTTLAWPALIPDDGTANALLDLNRAQNWQDFRQALTQMVAPQQNIFFADTQGDIGFVSPALVPIRLGYDGALPLEGWTREEIWSGFIPFDELPQAHNPPAGKLANANNRIVGPDYPYLIATEWVLPYRAERIESLLSVKPQFTPQDFEVIQNDSLSLAAQEILPLLRRVSPASPEEQRALTLLRNWQGEMDRTLPQPLLFHAWMAALDQILMQEKLGDLYQGNRGWPYKRWLALLSEPSDWCAPAPNCSEQLSPALTLALQNLSARGLKPDNMENWQWGDWHKTRLSHRLLGRIPYLSHLTDKVVPSDGADDTVNRGTPRWPLNPETDSPLPRGYEQVHGASFRVVYDLADLENSRFIITTGQAGNPLSDKAFSFTDAWKDGLYLKLVAPETDQSQAIRLIPQ
ncbi:penicillin acylase family protein [Rhodovibrionaceae bacterium A322]